jgi:NAD(P)-dependent dehydrogenase (short-subunit alcohol dehydrogenase family)
MFDQCANAGIQGFKPILDWQDADWQDTIDINLTGTCNATRAIAPHLVRNGRPLFWKPKRKRDSAQGRRSAFRGSSLRRLRQQLYSSRRMKPTW